MPDRVGHDGRGGDSFRWSSSDFVGLVFIDLLLCQIPESTVAVSLGVRSCPEDKGHILS